MNRLSVLGWLASLLVAVLAVGSLAGLRLVVSDVRAVAVLAFVAVLVLATSLAGGALVGDDDTPYW